LETTSWKTVVSDNVTLATSSDGVFSGGDVINGGGTVIEAIADGQRAAIAIDQYLGGSGTLPPDVSMSLYRASDEELAKAITSNREPMLSVEERLGGFREVVNGFQHAGACAEANRCLRCDLEKHRS
jgi:NADPH-dependent glutamate synthase beta subunit-like oxidoreductase